MSSAARILSHHPDREQRAGDAPRPRAPRRAAAAVRRFPWPPMQRMVWWAPMLCWTLDRTSNAAGLIPVRWHMVTSWFSIAGTLLLILGLEVRLAAERRAWRQHRRPAAVSGAHIPETMPTAGKAELAVLAARVANDSARIDHVMGTLDAMCRKAGIRLDSDGPQLRLVQDDDYNDVA